MISAYNILFLFFNKSHMYHTPVLDDRWRHQQPRHPYHSIFGGTVLHCRPRETKLCQHYMWILNRLRAPVKVLSHVEAPAVSHMSFKLNLTSKGAELQLLRRLRVKRVAIFIFPFDQKFRILTENCSRIQQPASQYSQAILESEKNTL